MKNTRKRMDRTEELKSLEIKTYVLLKQFKDDVYYSVAFRRGICDYCQYLAERILAEAGVESATVDIEDDIVIDKYKDYINISLNGEDIENLDLFELFKLMQQLEEKV